MSSDPISVPALPVEPADLVAAAALGVEGVTALAAGTVGTVATYLPGRRVVGVAFGQAGAGTEAGPRVAVHLVVDYGTVIAEVARRVRVAVGAALDVSPAHRGVPVDVHVDDVTAPEWILEPPPPHSEPLPVSQPMSPPLSQPQPLSQPLSQPNRTPS